MKRLGIVMRPDPARSEEAGGVLNPAAARGPNGELYLFPRMVGADNRSRIGIARVVFDDEGIPRDVERLGYALEPREPYELRPDQGQGGCEDPRVTFIDALGIYAMAYAAFGPAGPRLAVAVSEDCLSWERLGPVHFAVEPELGVDFNDYDNKDGAFSPEVLTRPDGSRALAFLHRPMYENAERAPRGIDNPLPSIWVSYCEAEVASRDLHALTRVHRHMLGVDPENPWEQLRIGGGTPPIRTHLGMLMVYHGVAGTLARTPGARNAVNYTAGALIYETAPGGKILYRSTSPILIPEIGEETSGVVDNVVFPTGIDDRGDGVLDIYYGMGDQRIGAARMKLPDEISRN